MGVHISQNCVRQCNHLFLNVCNSQFLQKKKLLDLHWPGKKKKEIQLNGWTAQILQFKQNWKLKMEKLLPQKRLVYSAVGWNFKMCLNYSVTFRSELNLTFSKLLNAQVQLFSVSVRIAQQLLSSSWLIGEWITIITMRDSSTAVGWVFFFIYINKMLKIKKHPLSAFTQILLHLSSYSITTAYFICSKSQLPLMSSQ